MPDRVVSFEDEELILVDEDNNEIGHLDKGACHDGDGVLHRAFSIFIFSDTGELLLQQRSPEKRLWPEFWSNSCCSHPRRGEEMDTALKRRLNDELGMRSELHFLYTFSYHVPFGDVGSEREVCSVYAGHSTDEVRANPHEIDAWRWISAEDLDREMDARPGDFTPWFLQEWQEVRGVYHSVLGFSEAG